MSFDEALSLPQSARNVLIEELNDKVKREWDFRKKLLKKGF